MADTEFDSLSNGIIAKNDYEQIEVFFKVIDFPYVQPHLRKVVKEDENVRAKK